MNHRVTRNFQSLRLSLGSACDLACSYCVAPKEVRPQAGELKPKDLARLANLLHRVLGLKKIRFTGGEPLLGNRLERLIEALGPLDGVERSLTTNGQLLKGKLKILHRAGIQRLNVSLDSLNPRAFTRLTQGGELKKTLQGIDAALDQGFKLKLNMIPQKGINQNEVGALLNYALGRGMELRYIELMRMGHLRKEAIFSKLFYGQAEILRALKKDFLIRPLNREWAATATRYEVVQRGFFGMIANESAPFCRDCDRLRLSPRGELVGCLSSEKSFSLVPLLGLSDLAALAALPELLKQALAEKREQRFTGSGLWMKEVGG